MKLLVKLVYNLNYNSYTDNEQIFIYCSNYILFTKSINSKIYKGWDKWNL